MQVVKCGFDKVMFAKQYDRVQFETNRHICVICNQIFDAFSGELRSKKTALNAWALRVGVLANLTVSEDGLNTQLHYIGGSLDVLAQASFI